jgi:hypothetical protein
VAKTGPRWRKPVTRAVFSKELDFGDIIYEYPPAF